MTFLVDTIAPVIASCTPAAAGVALLGIIGALISRSIAMIDRRQDDGEARDAERAAKLHELEMRLALAELRLSKLDK